MNWEEEGCGMKIKTAFAEYDNVFLTKGHYYADGSLAIRAFNDEDGPITNVTVCLCDKTLQENEAYVDTNNFPGALEFIEENGLGKPTGGYRQSGYCLYPKVKFNPMEIDKHVRNW
jgi:hypothetical protein